MSDDDSASRARGWGSATIFEAGGQLGALPSQIRPLNDATFVCGPALTVASAPRDNLWLHRALSNPAARGTVLVATVGGAFDAGYWGEIMTAAAQQRGILGLVIDGCVRDRQRLVDMGFPVFCRGYNIRGTTKLPDAPGGINVALQVGDVTVHARDLVIGDADGVVVVPGTEVETVFTAAAARADREREILSRLAAGESTVAVYGWG